MEQKERQISENVITPKKIWENMKRFWWFCLIPLVVCACFIYRDTMSTYRKNCEAVQKDTYIASALVYYPTENGEIGNGNLVIFKSKNTMDKVNEILLENGYEPFDDSKDTLEIGHTLASYGISLTGEGEERMLCMGQAYAESMLEVIEEATGVSGYIIDAATVAPCMIDASNNTIIYSDITQKQVSLSLRDFLTWKKVMILCAGVFLGLALIFVAILFDQKVRSREEIDALGQLPCMGVIRKKREDDKKVVYELAKTVCQSHEISNLLMATVGKNPDIEKLAQDFQTATGTLLQVQAGESVLSSSETIERCKTNDGLILVIRANKDTMVSVRRTIDMLEMMDVKTLGYILIE